MQSVCQRQPSKTNYPTGEIEQKNIYIYVNEKKMVE